MDFIHLGYDFSHLKVLEYKYLIAFGPSGLEKPLYIFLLVSMTTPMFLSVSTMLSLLELLRHQEKYNNKYKAENSNHSSDMHNKCKNIRLKISTVFQENII